MKVVGAYGLVVLVWSTTPLFIQFSNDSLSFVSAITLRVLFAFICCMGLLRVIEQPLVEKRSDWLVYMASGLGLFPTMLLVYWAAQYIPSGLMSIIMGLYPFCVGLVSYVVLKENVFTMSKCTALVVALMGLGIIHFDQASIGEGAVWGVLSMICVCVFWAFSSVYVKKLGSSISPVRIGAGSLAVALPFFLVTWVLIDGAVPTEVGWTSIMGVAYLVIVGSVISHTLWFYVLQKCSVSNVSLIPLITPVMAITWGVIFAGEDLSENTLWGSGIILLSLGLYQGVFQRAYSYLSKICLGLGSTQES